MKISTLTIATIALIIPMLGITVSVDSKANDTWKTWESLRWRGLIQFKEENLSGAKKSFEEALREAKRIAAESENTALSIYDIAQVCDAEGNNRETENYCNEALKLAQKVCPNSGLRTLILISLEGLRRDERDLDGMRRLDDEIIRLNKEHPEAQCIAGAEMLANGTIEVRDYGEPHTYSITPVSNPNYRDLLMHIGPLRPDHPQSVIQWTEEKKEKMH
jgi:tetratricopeptide (TPR) repeat protein